MILGLLDFSGLQRFSVSRVGKHTIPIYNVGINIDLVT